MQQYTSQNSYNTSFSVDRIDYLGEDLSTYYFGIYYNIKLSEIVRSSLSKLEITVLKPSNAQPVNNFIEGYKSFSDSAKYEPSEFSEEDDLTYDPNILALLTQTNQIVKNADFQNSLIVASLTIPNLINYVPKDAVPLLKNQNIQISSIESLRKKVKTLRRLSQAEIDSITGLKENAISKEYLKKLNFELLTRYSQSPAEVLKKDNKISNEIVDQIKSFYLSSMQEKSYDPDNDYYTLTDSNTYLDNIRLRAFLPIKKDALDNVMEGYIKIKYDIYKDGNVNPLFTVNQPQVFLQDFAKISKLIKKEPSASIFYSNKDKTTVTFSQNDRNANKISVYKKDVSTSGDYSEFRLQKEFFVNLGSYKEFTSSKDSYRSIFRFVPEYIQEGQDIISSNFKDIVIEKEIESFFDASALVITDSAAAKDRLLIQLINPPIFATQYKIAKKQILNGVIRHDTESVLSNFKSVFNSTVEDTTVIDGESYEYTVYYKTEGGTVRRSKSYVYYYKNTAISQAISTKITNFTTSKDEADELTTTFNISTKVTPGTESNKLIQLLKQNGVYDELFSSTENINDTFQELLFHKVTRINLLTGEREVFEKLEDQNIFEDSPQTRKINSISPLKMGVPYQYEVRISLVNVNAALRDYVATEINPITDDSNNRIYYNPYKWKQPITKKTGMLLAQDNKNNFRSSYSTFDNFELGVAATQKLEYSNFKSDIVKVTAKNYQTNLNYIEWEIPASLEAYDHFVIVKEINKKRQILDVVYSTEYFDVLSEDKDVGRITYYVTPVLADYSVGKTVKSQSMLISPSQYEFYN